MGNSPIDHLSSVEAFEKVCERLKNYIGSPVFVVKPEVGLRKCHGRGIDESYSDIGRLGFLSGSPVFEGFMEIVLPMVAHILNPMGVGHLSKKSAPINFNCMDPERIHINPFSDVRGEINIYAGNDAVENKFGEFFSSNYLRACNLLGTMPQNTDFFNLYSEEIAVKRTEAVSRANELLENSLHRSPGPGNTELTHLVIEWVMKDGEMNRAPGVNINLGDYTGL